MFVGELLVLFVLNPLALTVLDPIGVFETLMEPVVVFVLKRVHVDNGLELLVLDTCADLVGALDIIPLLV